MEVGFIISISMALTEMAKRIGLVSSKWIPLLVTIICVVLEWALFGKSIDAFWHGVQLGLIGIGLFSGMKNVGEGVRLIYFKSYIIKDTV